MPYMSVMFKVTLRVGAFFCRWKLTRKKTTCIAIISMSFLPE